jgi:hypothetical protein
MDDEFSFDHLFQDELCPLDLDFEANNPQPVNYAVPSININRSNSIPSQPTSNWQPVSPMYHLSPIQTDVPGSSSPGFSTPSQASDSSYGFLSPSQIDPLTPSPTSPQEQSYAAIRSPRSATGRFDSQSPATGSLGLKVFALSLSIYELKWTKCAV